MISSVWSRLHRKRRNISCWCVRSGGLTKRDRQITARRKNTHRQWKRKKNSHRHEQTNRRGGGSVFMTPHSHLDHFHAHVRTQGSEKRALQTTHCWADLFKSQELCLSFPYILLTETFGSERRCFLFFFLNCLLYAYVHTWRPRACAKSQDSST